MNVLQHLPKIVIVAVLVGGAGIMVSRLIGPAPSAVVAGIKQPRLSGQALSGKKSFDAACAQCHGPSAAGSDQGPPLIHTTYNPGHHADAAFFLAVKNGVRQHHWPFGDMPAQPDVSEKDVLAIVRYVREMQVANGILYRPHNM